MDSISRLTHRRFILGQQGLWPGRRFKGLRGAGAAIRMMGALQLDPLNILARSQHIAMYGRVLGYEQEHLDRLAYEKRQFFDYGGMLHLYPFSELPYWRLHMRRRATHGRWGTEFARSHQHVIREVLAALRDNGPLGNRDFEGNLLANRSYRGGKETSIALYYLWLTGEVMISHRQGFDRFYDLSQRIVPPEWDHEATEAETEDYFARKIIASEGLLRPGRFRANWEYTIGRDVSREESARVLSSMVEQGVFARVQVEGEREPWIALSENLPLLTALEAGRIPRAWKPAGPTTEEEATLLAPLEPASARGRAKQLFGFDYIWEVYKPVHQRRWGYYTLPILYGDDLVARLDARLDRPESTLRVLGFWLEEDAPVDAAFGAALGRGLARFARMAGAKKVNAEAITPVRFRREAMKAVKSATLEAEQTL